LTDSTSKSQISPRAIKRLSIYRRALSGLPKTHQYIFSSEIAKLCGVTSAQVRRDMMAIKSVGSSRRGYEVAGLIKDIDAFFAVALSHNVALIGVGTLGRSLLAYFQKRYYRLSITAVFDRDPELTGRIVNGVRCYSMEKMEEIVRETGISIAVLALPDDSAKEVVDQLVAAGVTGILNFAPTSLVVPETVTVENIDIASALDRLAFIARKRTVEDRNPDADDDLRVSSGTNGSSKGAR